MVDALVDDDVQLAVAVPINEAELPAAARAHARLAVDERLAAVGKREEKRFVRVRAHEQALRSLQEPFPVRADRPFEIGKVSHRVEHHEVGKPVPVEIDRRRCRTPLREQTFPHGLVVELERQERLFALPFHFDRLRAA